MEHGDPDARVEIDWNALSPELSRTVRRFTWGSIALCCIASAVLVWGLVWSSVALVTLAALQVVVVCGLGYVGSRRLRDRAEVEAAARAGLPLSAVDRSPTSRPRVLAGLAWVLLSCALLALALTNH